jgi:hypothetical protein
MNTKRERGFALYLAIALVAATGLTAWGVLSWDKGRLAAAHKAGHTQAMTEVKTAQVAAENRALLNQREQIISLNSQLTKATNAYLTSQTNLVDARNRAVASGKRVHDTASGDALDRRVAAADLSTLRTFGTGAFRTAVSCRESVAEIGLGAGGLVESASAYRFEHARAEALMKFSMPKSPFNKTKE